MRWKMDVHGLAATGTFRGGAGPSAAWPGPRVRAPRCWATPWREAAARSRRPDRYE